MNILEKISIFLGKIYYGFNFFGIELSGTIGSWILLLSIIGLISSLNINLNIIKKFFIIKIFIKNRFTFISFIYT